MVAKVHIPVEITLQALPLQTVVGEVPELKPSFILNERALNSLQIYDDESFSENPANSISWVILPDVSHVGQTSGKVEIKYVAENNTDASGQPLVKTLIVPVTVSVSQGQNYYMAKFATLFATLIKTAEKSFTKFHLPYKKILPLMKIQPNIALLKL